MNRKDIPGTLGFQASKDGRIFGPDGEEKNQYTNGDGYKTAAVLVDNGTWVTFGVQRLVALAHKPTDGDTSTLTVNHIDLDVTNNHADNLEWVTVAHNNQHASLMRTDRSRPTILCRDEQNRPVMFLQNMVAAAEALGCDILDVWDAIREGTLLGNMRLYHHGVKDIIPVNLRKPTIKERDERGRPPVTPVLSMNVDDGTIESFDSLADCARHFETSPSHIYQMISRGDVLKLLRKQYALIFANQTWPDINEETIRVARDTGPKAVLAMHPEDNLTAVYESASSFIKLTGISKKAVTTRLKQGKITPVDGWWFTYFDSGKSKERLEAAMERPGS